MKFILLIDDKQEHANSTIQIFAESNDLKDAYSFLTDVDGNNLGCSIAEPNETEPFKERCDKAFQLVKDNIRNFDILMIDGFLLDSAVERVNHLVSLEVINKIFFSSLDLSQKNIYIITGYNTKISVITYSDIYVNNKDKLVLLVRPTDILRRNNRPEACIFRDENGGKCTRWENTVYYNPTLSEKCTYEQCLTDIFLKAERSN